MVRRQEALVATMSGKIVTACDNCGGRVERVPSQFYKYKHHFCCTECKIAFSVGVNAPNYVSGLEEVFCDNCGEPLLRHHSRINGRNFCDIVCSGEFWSGEGNPNYGNIHADNVREAQSLRMKTFYSDPMNRERHSALKQGISYDEWEGFAIDKSYCPAFDETCRESNRDKYGRRCFLCGLDEYMNITSTYKPRKLSVHHVDMNKDQGCDGHSWKLVPLCLHHHTTTHNDIWMNRIMYLLKHVWNKV